MLTDKRIELIKNGVDLVQEEGSERFQALKIDDIPGYKTMVRAHNKIDIEITELYSDFDAHERATELGVRFHDGYVAGIENTFKGWHKLYFGK